MLTRAAILARTDATQVDLAATGGSSEAWQANTGERADPVLAHGAIGAGVGGALIHVGLAVVASPARWAGALVRGVRGLEAAARVEARVARAHVDAGRAGEAGPVGQARAGVADAWLWLQTQAAVLAWRRLAVVDGDLAVGAGVAG